MTTLGPYVQSYVGERLRRGEIANLRARSLRNHLRSFADSHGNRTLEQLGPKAVEKWLSETTEHAPSTRAGQVSALRGFARWLVLNDIIAKDFTLTAPRIRRPRQAPRDMTADDVAQMLRHCGTVRETLVIWLMFGAGLRCVEVSRLNVEDYDGRSLHVTGKSGHERTVPVGAPLRRVVDAYLTIHPTPCGPLVQREDDRPGRLGPERISGLVGRISRRSGVKRRNFDGRGAHGIRACSASDLADVCNDPRVLQEYLGHAGLANLDKYLRRQTLDKVREAVNLRWDVA